MNLAGALLPRIPAGGSVAFVGGGGKTTAMLTLGLALGAAGRSVLMTTTTHLAEPGPGPLPYDVLVRPELAEAGGGGPLPRPGGRPALLVTGPGREARKVAGVHPAWIPRLRTAWDVVLVEADGSRRLPVKAPAPHEPRLPEGPCLVVGLVGLSCLGRPLDAGTVHRPDRFAAVTGCAPGAPITATHLANLVRHPEGLFKGAGPDRVLVLNQADRCAAPPGGRWARALAPLPVLLGSLEAGDGGIVWLEEVP
ncbi:selenium cofactor biosynthesis protein YqeC [Mesoterricola sediminis]|uniref:Selenium-dependent hydroxylase accessory protein YqeC n=1 Tax=Mesoterricola sediminis TaxID=2927980 RepID=A0AA48GYT2_9BACT|nr:selenium cofactor biosynthesis protein YqeC [Mesoterricola sediminis]BDU78764.1 hypothetical protein METESE_37220 [Mesoterricola sediminis]